MLSDFTIIYHPASHTLYGIDERETYAFTDEADREVFSLERWSGSWRVYHNLSEQRIRSLLRGLFPKARWEKGSKNDVLFVRLTQTHEAMLKLVRIVTEWV